MLEKLILRILVYLTFPEESDVCSHSWKKLTANCNMLC